LRVTELGGGEKNTTNNRMELTACAEALLAAAHMMAKHSADAPIEVYTDSSYVINGITKWINGWRANGWKTKTKDDVLNKDLWIRLYEATKSCAIKWHHIGGHVGVAGNERCDEIATAFADKFMSVDKEGAKIELYKGLIANYAIKNILNTSHDQDLMAAKKSTSARSNARAYSYVSKVDGVIQTHKTWAECESRVKGKKGVRFKKALSIGDEAEIIESFRK
jgi:ribonuclease HI